MSGASIEISFDSSHVALLEALSVDHDLSSAPNDWEICVVRDVAQKLALSAPFKLTDRHENGSIPQAEAAGLRVAWNPTHAVMSVLNLKTRQGVWIASQSSPPWDYAAPLRTLLQWIAAQEGILLVHAGSVIAEDKALLLVGPGGSGKSSAVAMALQAGLASAGEDYLQLGCHQNKLKVTPLYKTLKLRKGSPMYPERAQTFGPDVPEASEGSRACVQIAPNQLNSGEVVGVVVMHVQGPVSPQPLDSSIALRSLVHSTALQANHDQAWILSQSRNWLASIPAYWLGHCNAGELRQAMTRLLRP